jgi:ABC-type ATPase involved in cell division
VEGTSAPGAGNVEVRVDLATIPTISGGSGAGNASTIDLIEKIVRHLVGKGTAIG